MNELANSIRLLYEPDTSPVVAVSGGCILFFNPAARRLFPALENGQRASKLLPEAFLSCDDTVFAAAAPVERRLISASGVWHNGMLMLRMNTDETRCDFSPESATTTLRIELASMRLALDQLNDGNTDASALAVLRHSYFRMLRCCENISLADQLYRHNTVFRPVSVDPAEWLRGLTEILQESASKLGIGIRLKCSGDIPLIKADPELLDQLLLNLISNSLRHSAPGSEISLRLKKDGSRLLLAVDDRGSGFSPETLGGLFSRRFGNGGPLPERSGMGLFIVFGIAQLHGASVTASNRSRGGVTVQIRIPLQHSDYLPLHTARVPYSTAETRRRRVVTALSDVLRPEDFTSPA